MGAVGFVPRYAGAVYPVSLVRADDDTGEPIRGLDGLCQICEPGNDLVNFFVTFWYIIYFCYFVLVLMKCEDFRSDWSVCWENQP